MAQTFTLPKQVVIDPLTGNPAPGAKAYFYATGTSTPQTVYSDDELTTPITQPVVADSAGVLPVIYLGASADYKLTLTRTDETLLYTIDPLENVVTLSTAIKYDITPAETAAGVTPIDFSRRPGSWLRYGADPTGVYDSLAAINDALKVHPAPFDDYEDISVYSVSGKLRYQFCGQKLMGQGMGDNNTTGVFRPRTRIKYTGSAAGSILSTYPGSGGSHMSNCSAHDILFDGNALANKGVEGYDDTITGGCWRTKLYRCAFVGVTNGANPTNFYLGATGSAPDFAHDAEMHSCFIYGGARGAWGKGSKHQFFDTTFFLLTDCGIYGDTGSAWTTHACIFSTNNRDFDGLNIQQWDDHGSWFENSTLGIYRANTAHNFSLHGPYLHTNYATLMFDIGSAAGDWSITGERVGSTAVSTLIKNVNTTPYNYSVSGLVLTFEAGVPRSYRSGAHVNVNEEFAAGPTASTANNVTGDGTVYTLNAIAFTENYDPASVFDASTGIYTAGIAGKRRFLGRIGLANLGAAHTDGELRLVYGAQSYLLAKSNVGAIRNGSNEAFLSGEVTIFMTAGSTAYLSVVVSGSTKTVGVLNGLDATNWRTRFEGRIP